MGDVDDILRRVLKDGGWDQAALTWQTGDASPRRYARLRQPDGGGAMLMDARRETAQSVQAFVAIARHLHGLGLGAPCILHSDCKARILIVEDLGDAVFAQLMRSDPGCEHDLYRAAIDALHIIHAAPAPKSVRPMSDHALADMTGIAATDYAQRDASEAAELGAALRHHLATCAAPNPVLALRDFHSENLIWLPDRDGPARVGLLDFQDAVVTHPAYDLVSLLTDARRDVAPAVRAKMVAYYLSRSDQNANEFSHACVVFGVQRNLRILGVFARLAAQRSKPGYIDLIPRVWRYLMADLSNPALADLRCCVQDILPEPTPTWLSQLKGVAA